MAYRSRPYRSFRRRYYRRKTYKRPPQSKWQRYAGYAVKALNIASTVAGIVNTEYKNVETSSNTQYGTSGTMILLNGLSKGDNFNQRNGRSVLNKSLELELYMNQHASATTDTILKLCLLIDKSPDGAIPGTTDYQTGASITSFRNLDNRKRFITLKEFYITLSSGNNTYCHRNLYKKLNLHTIYDDSDNGDITDIKNNAIFLYIISNQATYTPTVNVHSRIRYLDN